MTQTHSSLETTALRIESKANTYYQTLITKINADQNLTEQCYAIKTRIKKHDAIMDKVHRKRKEKPYEAYNLTDIIGIRFVALLETNIVSIFKALMEFLIQNSQELKIEEVIYYIGDKKSTPILSEVNALFKENQEHIPQSEVNESDRGYSSLHVICKHQTKHNTVNNGYQLPIEIQIRNVFEDAWGEVDHKFVYSKDKERSDSSVELQGLQSHSKVLKELCDTCSSHASLIYTTSINNPALSTSSNTNLGSVEEILPEKTKISELLEKKNIPLTLVNKYKKGIELKKKNQLSEALETFYEIYNATLITSKDNTNLSFMKLYAGLNIAFIQLETNYLNEAISNYKALLKEFPTVPLISYRLGQSLGRKGLYQEAVEQLEKTKQLTKQAIDNKKLKTLDLPEEDYEHIRLKLPFLLGFYFWRQADKLTKGDKRKIELLTKAFDVTKDILSEDGLPDTTTMDTYNNLLYYAIDIYKIINNSKVKKHQKWANDIKTEAIPDFLKKIRRYYPGENFNLLFEKKEYSKLHTIIEALIVISKEKNALKLAERLKNTIMVDEKAQQNENNKEILVRITEFLNLNGEER